MKVYRITSDRSSVPLAEIRESNGQIEFIVDNTNGSLPKAVGGKYEKLLQMVNESSHLSMHEPQEATAHLLRYVLSNGDVVEITTDGKTAVLNGRLLIQEEKNALFQAIKTGQLSIARKADLAAPQPVLPAMQSFPKPTQKSNQQLILSVMEERAKEEQKKKRDSSVDFDHSIESANYKDQEDPEWAKQFMYIMKYGATRGRK